MRICTYILWKFMLIYNCNKKKEEKTMAILQERIKSRRLELGFTLLEMADLLGVKEATMQRYESGEIKNIKHDTIVAIAEILKCTPQYLMGWSDLMYEPKSINDVNIFLHPSLIKNDSDFWATIILENYNKMTDEGKKKLIDYSNDLLEIDKYNKSKQPEK